MKTRAWEQSWKAIFSQGLLNTVDQSLLDLPLLNMTNIYLNNEHYHSFWQFLHQQLKGHGQSFHMYNACRNTLWYTWARCDLHRPFSMLQCTWCPQGVVILVDSRGNPQLKTHNFVDDSSGFTIQKSNSNKFFCMTFLYRLHILYKSS